MHGVVSGHVRTFLARAEERSRENGPVLGTVTITVHLLGFGLRPEQRSVLGLGPCTPNLGAALAPVMAVAAPDPPVLLMLVLGVPVTVGLSVAAAAWYGRRQRAVAAPLGR